MNTIAISIKNDLINFSISFSMADNYKVRFIINKRFVEVYLDITEDEYSYVFSMHLDPWQSLCYSVEKLCASDLDCAIKCFIHFVEYLNKCKIEVYKQK